jgi:hypothetical protein
MLRLIGQDETADVSIDGTTFTVRKVPHGEIEVLKRKHSKRGRLDEEAYAIDLWPRILVGWNGLCDSAGKPVEFVSGARVTYRDPVSGEQHDVPLAYAIAQWLPDSVVAIVMQRARELELAHGHALGNSTPSSRSATPGTEETRSSESSSGKAQASPASTSNGS